MSSFLTRHIRRALMAFVAMAGLARAHNGPPFPIMEGKRTGPVVIALWTHPDIGTGTFWIMIDPPPGGKIPPDLKVKIGVQPVDGRIPERIFDPVLDEVKGQLQYKALVPFDRDEVVRARVILSSSEGPGEAAASVEVTPVGPGSRWELLLYMGPFLGVAFLWFRAIARGKRRVSRATSQSRSVQA
jgi:hypothetical protein